MSDTEHQPFVWRETVRLEAHKNPAYRALSYDDWGLPEFASQRVINNRIIDEIVERLGPEPS